MPDPIIALEDVTLKLRGNAGPVEILHGLTMQVHKGETLGLVGPSGSGKSSLLMVMGGLEAATSGQVRVLGEIWHARSQQPVRRGQLLQVTDRSDLMLDVKPDDKEETS